MITDEELNERVRQGSSQRKRRRPAQEAADNSVDAMAIAHAKQAAQRYRAVFSEVFAAEVLDVARTLEAAESVVGELIDGELYGLPLAGKRVTAALSPWEGEE